MGYRVLRNLWASGTEFKAGDTYTGPSDLVEGLLKSGALEETTEVISKSKVSEEPALEESDVFGEEEVKPKKKKGKGK